MPQGALARVLAEVSIEPAVEGAANGQLVRRAIEALDGPELTLRIGPLGATLEGELDDVLHAVVRACRSVAGSVEPLITHVASRASQPASISLRRDDEWLYVDFDEYSRSFYLDACGFSPDERGLLAL